MPEQPRDMDELILSLRTTHRAARHPIIATPRTTDPSNLPSAQRAIWRAAELQVLATSMNVAGMPPGTAMTLESQTDAFYLDSDPGGITSALINHLYYLGQRIR
jgi:hypothetical protein